MNSLKLLYEEFGQSPWVDNIRRDWLTDGTLSGLVAAGARGVTSNPSIFAKAIAGTSLYDDEIQNLRDRDNEAIFEILSTQDVQAACDLLASVHEESRANNEVGKIRYFDGFVSLEVSPRLAHDAKGTVGAALEIARNVNRSNLMVKIPATREGLQAIEDTVAAGVSVNVTLIFSVERYVEVLQAWSKGLRRAKSSSIDASKISSVASFFVSRIDSAVDALLPPTSPLRGRTALSEAALVYRAFLEYYSSGKGAEDLAEGFQVQRPLWASTSVKDPAYDELLYVDCLVAPETVNTMPDATWKVASARANGELSFLTSQLEIDQLLQQATDIRELLDLTQILEKLETDGVSAFQASYDELLDSIEAKKRIS